MKKTILFFIIINIIVLGNLYTMPLQAIDVAQRQGTPSFKNNVQAGKIQSASRNKVLTQTFLPKAKSLTAVGFYSEPFPDSIDEVFFLSIKQHNKVLRKSKIRTGELKPGLNIVFFKPLNLNRDRYAVEFTTNDSNKQNLNVWSSKTNVYKPGRMLVNGGEKDMDIVFQTYYPLTIDHILGDEISPNPPIWPLLFLVPFLEIFLFVGAWFLDRLLRIDSKYLRG